VLGYHNVIAVIYL